jgi:hypothetical protein
MKRFLSVLIASMFLAFRRLCGRGKRQLRRRSERRQDDKAKGDKERSEGQGEGTEQRGR